MTSSSTTLVVQPAASLFWSEGVAAANATVDAGTGSLMTVHTPAERWAYAVTFTRTDASSDNSIVVRLTVRVTSGSVGAGVLNVEGTRFIDEAMADASGEPRVIELVVADPSDMGLLIVRNTSPLGASVVEVLDISCFQVDAGAEAMRHPGLSEPVPAPHWNRHYGATASGTLERLRAARFNAMTLPTTLAWSDGLSLQIRPKDQLSRAVFLSGTYEPNTLCVLRSLLRQGDVFLDIGANAGVIALAASKWVGPAGCVFAFEPSCREFDRLIDTLERNRAANIQPFRVAVGARSGTASLRVASDEFGGLNTVAAAFAYDGVELARIEQVPATSLDEFLAARDVRVAAIKIDVEGAEADILAGAQRTLARDRPALVVEIFSRSLETCGSSREALEQILRAARYRFYAIGQHDASLRSIQSLTEVDEQNVVALPQEETGRPPAPDRA
jgi:FkbM family methyltransferase